MFYFYLFFVFLFFPVKTFSESVSVKQDTKPVIGVNFSFSSGNSKENSSKEEEVKQDENNLEADFLDNKHRLEFCCDREYKAESAHDISEEESQRIVDKVLVRYLPHFKREQIRQQKGQR